MKFRIPDRMRAPLRFQAGVLVERLAERKFTRGVAAVAAAEQTPPRKFPVRLWAAASLGLILFAHWELATSAFESRILSTLASKMKYSVGPGRSPLIEFPRRGPFDQRRGYSRVPEFTQRLEDRGFRFRSQARFTQTLAMMTRLGVAPPYREPALAGLVISGLDGKPLYDAMGGRRTFTRFEQVPQDVVKCLVFIENRELDREGSPYSNPAIDWSRSAKGVVVYLASRMGFPTPVEGGSTLAVQMEKYRHSPEGRTTSAAEKLRQMIAASLRVYREGPETTEERHQIVLDYVNTVPLGGAPGYGEIFGLNEGLRVWFGADPDRVYRALAKSRVTKAKAKAMKQLLALVCAVRAPTRYLTADRQALEERVDRYAKLMGSRGVIEPKLAEAIERTSLRFAPMGTKHHENEFDKATVLVRRRLMNLLAVRDYYELDRLHINVETTIDADLERDVTGFFHRLTTPEFVDLNGLRAPRLLASGDPRLVIYSMILRERTPEGDVVRVHADNVDGPFDVNEGTKMELGSTAKLRTLVHYLSVMSDLHGEMAALSANDIEGRVDAARDPLTRWAAETLREHPGMSLEDFLNQALERKYSASPYEMFYTGGGFLSFQNYEPSDNDKTLPLREGAVRSTNLVFVRLMRDLVRYHEARLPYNVERILGPDDTPERLRMLREVAREEGTPEQMAWLFRTRNRNAQDLRLRARIERDAFARMTPYWRRLGFPFPRLVPSYATAIGSSSDQPAALADLMGILMNDGVRRPPALIHKISFGDDTPYETTLEALASNEGHPLITPEVARVTRGVLGAVVERGTAQRLRGAFTDSTGAPVWVGGKTGTGDNRFESFGRGRQLISSRAVSRTAAFAFCLGDRYYGVITASVMGPRSDEYSFTSSLPVETLRLLAPTLKQRLHLVGGASPHDPSVQPTSELALGDADASIVVNADSAAVARNDDSPSAGQKEDIQGRDGSKKGDPTERDLLEQGGDPRRMRARQSPPEAGEGEAAPLRRHSAAGRL